MSDEYQLQVRPKDNDSSLTLSRVRSGLIARGLRDAAMLTAPGSAESEEQRAGLFDVLLSDWFDDRPTDRIRKDAEEGDAKQQNILALRYRHGWRASGTGRDLAESARWHRRAADQGFAPAQFNLGWMYDNSYLGVPGVGQDYAEAAKWYRKAADQGFGPAEFNLGVMYDNGEGLARDYAEAAKWYRKAADQGLRQGQFNLGLKYDNGERVEQDYAEAAKWYRKAADQGLAKAQFNLGLKSNNGQGVVQDYVQAHMWMTLAVAHTSVDDGKRYAAVRDRVAAKMTPTQIAEAQRLAAHWYRNTAGQGGIVAQLNLGVMYTFGQGVAQDYGEAAKWYRKAADQGFDKAQFNLGLLYEYGLGVAEDYVQAHMWMTLAVAHPSVDDGKRYAAVRDRVAAKMTPTQIAEAQRLAREWKRSGATRE